MKRKDILIISSIVICLSIITIYKVNEEKALNLGTVEGFEYYTDSNYTLEKDGTSGYPMMLILGSSTCNACKDLDLVAKKLNKKYQGIVKIKYVDIYENIEIRKRFNPIVTPTIYFGDKAGKIRYSISGTTTEKEIINVFKKIGVKIDG